MIYPLKEAIFEFVAPIYCGLTPSFQEKKDYPQYIVATYSGNACIVMYITSFGEKFTIEN